MNTSVLSPPGVRCYGSVSDTGPGEVAALDLQQLFDRCLGHFPLIDRLITGFRQSLAALLPQISTAEETGDLAALERLAHRLKGEAANLGATEISLCAARLEAAASGPISDLEAHVGELVAASKRFQASVFTFDSLPRPSSSAIDALARLRGAFRS